jgi:hypothetical protein
MKFRLKRLSVTRLKEFKVRLLQPVTQINLNLGDTQATILKKGVMVILRNLLHILLDYNSSDLFSNGDLEINNEAYNVPGVMDILRELPPFDWGAPKYKDGVSRVKRPILLLENGAKYEGEWIADTEIRDGRGI